MDEVEEVSGRERYARALARLYGLQGRGMRLELDRVRTALAMRGHPERALPCIHVAGTNGKGSVASSLASILGAAGRRVGLFTSPHLHRFVERVRVDGEPLAEDEAAARLEALLDWAAQPDVPPLTFFEVSFILALEVFAAHHCDVAVLEVGLGGRLDATNATPSILSIVTRIALDHTHILGDSIAAIAGEKAGIFRQGVPAVLGVRDPEAAGVMRRRLAALDAPASWIDRDFGWQAAEAGRITAWIGDRELGPLEVPLRGRHQRDNLTTAIAAAHALGPLGFASDDAAIATGIARVRWPGRLEQLPGRPACLLDAAHNHDGCAALCDYLDGLPRGRRALVFGAMADKDFAPMLRALGERVDHVVLMPLAMPRAASLEALQAVWPGDAAQDPAHALELAKAAAGSEGLVVVAGSIFLVGALRAALLGIAADPPIRM